MQLPHNLVSCQWLAQHIDDGSLVVFDAGMSPAGSAKPYLAAAIIKGAQRFDFSNHLHDTTNPLPNMMPNAAFFTQAMQAMGVSQTSAVVVYDDQGIYSAARAWWMFKAMGFNNVAVLDGGLPAWVVQQGPVQSAYSSPLAQGDFIAQVQVGLFIDAAQVLNSVADENVMLLDARPANRFSGEQAEPRAGMRAGHIPHSKNLPYPDVIEHGFLRKTAELKALFGLRVPSHVQQLQFSCGSGVTACILALAASELGYTYLAVYDGSWSEWGQRVDLPIDTH